MRNSTASGRRTEGAKPVEVAVKDAGLGRRDLRVDSKIEYTKKEIKER